MEEKNVKEKKRRTRTRDHLVACLATRWAVDDPLPLRSLPPSPPPSTPPSPPHETREKPSKTKKRQPLDCFETRYTAEKPSKTRYSVGESRSGNSVINSVLERKRVTTRQVAQPANHNKVMNEKLGNAPPKLGTLYERPLDRVQSSEKLGTPPSKLGNRLNNVSKRPERPRKTR